SLPAGATYAFNPASVTISTDGGSATSTLYITNSATTPAGTTGFDATVNDGSNKSGSGAFTVSPKALTMNGLSVPASKVYNGTTGATVSGTPTLQSPEAF